MLYFNRFSGGVSGVILKVELPAVSGGDSKNHVNFTR